MNPSHGSSTREKVRANKAKEKVMAYKVAMCPIIDGLQDFRTID